MKENQSRPLDSADGPHETQIGSLASHKKSTRYITAIAIMGLLLMVSLGITGYLAYQNHLLRKQFSPKLPSPPATTYLTPTKNPEPIAVSATATDSAEQIVPSEWKTFTSKLGFSFDYPTEWGEASEEIEDYGHNSDPSGTSYFLGFSNNQFVYAQGFSADYSSGSEGSDGFYQGDPKKPKQVIAVVHAETENPDCQGSVIGTNARLYGGWISFNLPSQKIGGVRLIVNTLSKKDIEIWGRKYLEEVSSTECYQEIPADNFLRLSKNKQLDQESLRNIAIFERIWKSSKVL